MDNRGGGGDLEVSDMRLYLSADYPVDAAVMYHADNRIVPVLIRDAHATVEFNVAQEFGSDVELSDNNLGISSKVLQIAVDEEVSDANLSVNGVSVRLHSSDAFLAFPSDVLGREYVLLSYRNGYTEGFGQPAGYDQPSEFAVIATEDNTEVEIIPSAPINNRETTESFTVSLKAGEVFFAQAVLDHKYDVSGTRVRANRPVAVFAGNRRTSVPVSVGNYRDHLVEQMIPTERWGTSAIVPPFYEITPGVVYDPVVRVVADGNDVAWTVNGVSQTPLKEGEVVEIPHGGDSPMTIEASGPIQVCALEHSVGVQSGGEFALGDPFMMLVPSPEQYDTAYVFQSIGHEQFTRHFINIVVPTDVTSSVYLDEVSLQAAYHPVPGTSYSYAQVPVQAGSHRIRAASSFGLMVYGYGEANSYGYIGGMRLPQRPAGVREDNAGLAGLSLHAVPQPARNGSTSVALVLPRPMRVSLALFSLNGEKVSEVLASHSLETGRHRFNIDMSGLSKGLYFCRLTTETGETMVEEIVLEE